MRNRLFQSWHMLIYKNFNRKSYSRNINRTILWQYFSSAFERNHIDIHYVRKGSNCILTVFETLKPDHHSADSIHSLVNPGDVVEICYPIFKHYAIVCDHYVNGYPTLISLSRRNGTVEEESWHQVTCGWPVNLSHIHGKLSGAKAVANARAYKKNKDFKWNLLTRNCEHFVRLAHGLPAESTQVRRSLTGALIGAASTVMLPRLTLARVILFAGTGALSSLWHHAQKRE